MCFRAIFHTCNGLLWWEGFETLKWWSVRACDTHKILKQRYDSYNTISNCIYHKDLYMQKCSISLIRVAIPRTGAPTAVILLIKLCSFLFAMWRLRLLTEANEPLLMMIPPQRRGEEVVVTTCVCARRADRCERQRRWKPPPWQVRHLFAQVTSQQRIWQARYNSSTTN